MPLQSVAAIAAKDPARARAAMHDHLQRSHDRFGTAWAGGDPAIRPTTEQEAA
jgi:DNA-binding GntR family transcriptional regulator